MSPRTGEHDCVVCIKPNSNPVINGIEAVRAGAASDLKLGEHRADHVVAALSRQRRVSKIGIGLGHRFSDRAAVQLQ